MTWSADRGWTVELERYLVADEVVIVSVRRHWFHLFRQISLAVVATLVAFWVEANVPLNGGGQILQNLSWLGWWLAIGWLVWEVLNWRRDWFVATDKRFLLFFGFIRRKVAMMPLLKVTDMTYDRSLLGRIVGYGTFVLESAGQEQAMSRIDHVPDADQHYKAICTQLFGPGSQIRLQSDGGFPSGGSFRPPGRPREVAGRPAAAASPRPVCRWAGSRGSRPPRLRLPRRDRGRGERAGRGAQAPRVAGGRRTGPGHRARVVVPLLERRRPVPARRHR